MLMGALMPTSVSWKPIGEFIQRLFNNFGHFGTKTSCTTKMFYFVVSWVIEMYQKFKLCNSCDRVKTSCTNTEGSYNCICRNGYIESKVKELTASGKNSMDGHTVDIASINRPGVSWIDDKGDIISSCIDIDECKNPDTCSGSQELTVCLNTLGSYQCSCGEGFQQVEAWVS